MLESNPLLANNLSKKIIVSKSPKTGMKEVVYHFNSGRKRNGKQRLISVTKHEII